MAYKITVDRTTNPGRLTFSGGGKTLSADCYWNAARKIPAGTYPGCSATTMSTKTNSRGQPREAVFIPNVSGFTGVFIHMGKPPYTNWSDGCIVVAEDRMLEIYRAVPAKDARNIQVVVNG